MTLCTKHSGRIRALIRAPRSLHLPSADLEAVAAVGTAAAASAVVVAAAVAVAAVVVAAVSDVVVVAVAEGVCRQRKER